MHDSGWRGARGLSGGVRHFAVIAVLAHLAGCMSKQGPASSPAPADAEPVPRRERIDAFERDLRRSEARLMQHLARVAPESTGAAASQREIAEDTRENAEPPAPAPAAPARLEEDSEEVPDVESVEAARAPEASGVSDTPCDLACRALASMQRAQVRICQIAGEGQRCDAARQRVVRAQERLLGAGCHCPQAGAGADE